MMQLPQTKPYNLNREEGFASQLMGALVRVKATSEQTGGAFNVFDVSCPRDYATPLYIHYAEDVAIFVVEGTLAVFWGSEKKKAVPGSYFFQPRGTPHGFRVEGDQPARILCMTIPAGLDRFVFGHELPSPDTDLEITAARYKIEILGPLPE